MATKKWDDLIEWKKDTFTFITTEQYVSERIKYSVLRWLCCIWYGLLYTVALEATIIQWIIREHSVKKPPTPAATSQSRSHHSFFNHNNNDAMARTVPV